MRVLRARLHQLAQDAADAEASAARRSQIRTVDRSERIRTYNFPENRALRPPHRLQVLQPRHRARRRARRGRAVGGRRRRGRSHGRRRGGVRLRSLVPVTEDAPADLRGRCGRGGPLEPAGRGRSAVAGAPTPSPSPPTCCEVGRRERAHRDGGRRPGAGPRGIRSAGRAPRRPGAPAAPHRARRVPPARARRRAGRVHAPPGDRGRGRPRHRRRARRRGAPVVVDLCTGSGAIALAVADEVPPRPCMPWSWGRTRTPGRRATSPTPGSRWTCVHGDATTPFPELDGTVDVVVSNPPYIPVGHGARSTPRCATTTPSWRSTAAARTAWRSRSRWPRARRCCCGPVGCSSWSTPTARVPRCRRAGADAAAGRDVRDERDLTGRPRATVAVRA